MREHMGSSPIDRTKVTPGVTGSFIYYTTEEFINVIHYEVLAFSILSFSASFLSII